jgi:hypothetical protein
MIGSTGTDADRGDRLEEAADDEQQEVDQEQDDILVVGQLQQCRSACLRQLRRRQDPAAEKQRADRDVAHHDRDHRRCAADRGRRLAG